MEKGSAETGAVSKFRKKRGTGSQSGKPVGGQGLRGVRALFIFLEKQEI